MSDLLADIFGEDDADWMQHPNRNCGQPNTDPDDWFPVRGEGSTGRPEKYAAAMCAGCPVANACLEYALARRELDGIWGGTTPEQRRKARRRTELFNNRPKPIECKYGHVYTEANTYITPAGRINCRKCAADKERAKRARRKALKESATTNNDAA